MAHCDIDYINTNPEEYKAVYCNGTSDYITKDEGVKLTPSSPRKSPALLGLSYVIICL